MDNLNPNTMDTQKKWQLIKSKHYAILVLVLVDTFNW